MSRVSKILLVVSLVLALVAVACADPADQALPSVQPNSEVTGTTTAVAEVVQPQAAETAAVVAMAEPPADAVKLTRLEPGVTSTAVMTAEERHLQARKDDFLKFAAKKLKDMNRNHILSRERMRIEKRPDGSYKASYHQLDDSSMSCQVSRSPSKGAQYVAVLSYKEQVYTASCRTPADCRQGEFSPAEVIPNRHIFVYNKGVWQ